MKHIRKSLLSLFAFALLLSCVSLPQQDVAEKFPTMTVDLAAEKGKASVVRITGGNLMKIGTGSGFFVQPDKVVTNLHVVARPGPIFVKLSDDETIWMVEGVTAYDMENDLVILKIAGEGVALSPRRQRCCQKWRNGLRDRLSRWWRIHTHRGNDTQQPV